MSLRLTLKPHERVIIGGAVLRNGPSQVRLAVENEVPVLREADILSPGAVRTPCERVYLALQLLYVDPGAAAQHEATYHALAAEVLEAAPSCRPHFEAIGGHLARRNYYQALKRAQGLLRHERRLLAHVH
ncbi:MAG TPA: flagellar biosynthesis repressor FlbT [Gemmatimonadales bacterium]|nr:flagellar biosynthesis repressor FlbT [Gemmatimonadales bacterium]